MTQISRPEADSFYPISGTTNWQNELGEQDQSLFESFNTFLPNDLTFAESEVIETVPTNSKVYVTKLSAVPNPEMASAGMTIRLRLAKDAAEGEFMIATVELREAWRNEVTDLGTLITDATFEGITEVFTEYSFPVTPEQGATILAFDELYLRIFFTAI